MDGVKKMEDEDIQYNKCYQCGNKKFYRVRKQSDSGWVYDGVQCTRCKNINWINSFFYP